MTPRPSPKTLSGAGKDFGRYAGLGLQFALTLLLLGALGWWLDGRWGTEPWLLVTGILLGSIVAFIAIVKAVPPARAVRVTKPPLPTFAESHAAEAEKDSENRDADETNASDSKNKR
ncbi:MAG: AtpZ/AtpI family protein [Planctomycetes bacterium]|nr:AtpZ/AtpI family protein [Planctomycetota bacterium]